MLLLLSYGNKMERIIKYFVNWYYQNEGYWQGPHNMWVPNHVDAVRAEDGVNTLFNDGSITKICGEREPTKEEYLEEWAVLVDGRYYWKIDYDNYWLGPYDMLIPKYVTYVPAEDGINIARQSGGTSLIETKKGLTMQQYLNKYATKYYDGKYYYNSGL